MALTNNTKFRRKKLTINKKVNGSIDTVGGFPVSVFITNAFPGYAALTDTEFRTLTDAQYNARLTAFYAHVQTLYPFWNVTDLLNTASGTDATLCPLDNSPTPTITVVSVSASMTPMQGGTYDDHLEWGITVQNPVTQDTSYYFDVDIKDRNNNYIKTETVFGVILSGQTTHFASNSEKYYIPEGSDPATAPLIVQAKIATVQF